MADQTRERLDQLRRLLERALAHQLGHHRRRSHRDAATRTLKRSLPYALAFDLQIDRERVAAQRVDPFGATLRPRQLTVVARILDVIQDQIVVNRLHHGDFATITKEQKTYCKACGLAFERSQYTRHRVST